MSSPMVYTRVNPKWLMKMVIITVFLVGFGFYGLYDATIGYPQRGIKAAEYLEWDYLRAIQMEKESWDRAPVKDPKAELARLTERLKAKTNVSPIESTRWKWLDQLGLVSRLKPEFTQLPDPAKRLEELDAKWKKSDGSVKSSPKPLAGKDIPVQWLITVVCFGLGLYLIGLIISVKRVKYGWEADAQRLVLPGGQALVPADIAEFDKRKWHKYLIFLKIKPEHPQLAGQELRLDLLRQTNLEEWILAMEKTAFPDNVGPGDGATDPGAPLNPEASTSAATSV